MEHKKLIELITRLNFARAERVRSINVSRSSFILKIIMMLDLNGLIRSFYILNDREIRIYLRTIYWKKGIKRYKIISKPSRKIYWGRKQLLMHKSMECSSTYLFLTSKGLMWDEECLMHNVYGEVLLKVKL